VFLASSGDDLSDIAIDADITLIGMEETDTGELSRCELKGEYLHPRNTKWFMKEEKKGWLKTNTKIFYTNSYTTIVIAKLYQTDRCCHVSETSDISSIAFLPFFPTSDMVGHSCHYWPDYENTEEEYEKYFCHRNSVWYFFSLQCSLKRRIKPL